MYLLPLSFCKILKKFLEPIQSYEDVPFSGSKWPICPEQNFFGTNHYYYFHLSISPFQCAQVKKILTTDPDLWVSAIFLPNMVQIFFFFWKIINIIFIYLSLPLPLCKIKKKKFPRRSIVMRMCNFWAQNGPFLQIRIFSENLLTSLVSFIHAYLHVGY